MLLFCPDSFTHKQTTMKNIFLTAGIITIAAIATPAFAASASDRGGNPPGDPALFHGAADPGGLELPGSDTAHENARVFQEIVGGSPAGIIG